MSSSSSTPRPAVRVCITGAAGQIGYSIIPLVAQGLMLGQDQPIILHLLDIPPAMAILEGVVMEIKDCANKLIHGVIATSDPEVAFRDIDYGLFLGAFPRGPGMERKDLLQKNASIFKDQGRMLNRVAKKTVKIVVVGNPANTNALILSTYAPDIPKENITALTRLDHNRGLSQIAERISVPTCHLCNMIVWGNHSSTQYPDVRHVRVEVSGEEKRLVDMDSDIEYYRTTFLKCVQQRGAAIIKARKLSSAMSAARAAVQHIRDWVLGTAEGTYVSMAVPVPDSSPYGIRPGIIYSFPCRCVDGVYTVVEGLEIDDWSAERMRVSEEELFEERRGGLGL